MKMWELTVYCTMPVVEQLFFFKKETTQTVWFTFHCMANTKEEAIQEARNRFEGMSYLGTSLKFDRAVKITNWCEWTVEKAMELLTGEQFAEYAKQNSLTSLFN